MEKIIACCGLNCAACEARIATLNDDNELRAATAVKWEKLYGAPHIPPELINCTGCREEGVKFEHCTKCEIRKCVKSRGFDTCGDCTDLEVCTIVSMIHQHVPEAIDNLRSLN